MSQANNILTISLLIVAVPAVGAALWKILGFIRRFVHAVDLVLHELVPNAGGSLRDAIDRIENNQETIQDHQILFDGRLAKVEARLEATLVENARLVLENKGEDHG